MLDQISLGAQPDAAQRSMLPPKSSVERTRPRRIIKSIRKPKAPPEWDDGFTRNAQIPEYHAYNDIHAQKFVGQRKKSTQATKFLDNYKNVGGIK